MQRPSGRFFLTLTFSGPVNFDRCVQNAGKTLLAPSSLAQWAQFFKKVAFLNWIPNNNPAAAGLQVGYIGLVFRPSIFSCNPWSCRNSGICSRYRFSRLCGRRYYTPGHHSAWIWQQCSRHPYWFHFSEWI